MNMDAATLETLQKSLLTVSQPEAARILGFSENTVAKWVRSGILPAKREPGGRARIRLADLEAFSASWPDYRAGVRTEVLAEAEERTSNTDDGIHPDARRDRGRVFEDSVRMDGRRTPQAATRHL